MENGGYELILQSKIYKIPLIFPSLILINPVINNKLLIKKRYKVKSRVNEQIFTSFVNYLVNNVIPEICLNNISEYDELSQEFDIMHEIIQIFKKFTSNSEIKILLKRKEELKQQISNKNNEIKYKKNFFNDVIQILFKNSTFFNYSESSEFIQDLYKKIRSGNLNLIDLHIKKKVTENGLTFALNEEEKTAGVFQCLTNNCDVFIPRSIIYKSTEYVITTIHENSFNKSNSITTIQFPENSQIKLIEKKSFANSNLKFIKFPKSVNKISENAFYSCKKLEKVEFQKESELKVIEKGAFELSQIEILSIPSSIKKYEEGWCVNASNLKNITVFPNKNEENFIYYENKFILGKSDSKSDKYDVLYFVRRDIEKVTVPVFIKKIASYAFSNCGLLKTVDFPENSKLKIIGQCAFYASQIEKISIPSSVTQIEISTFSSCKNLKSVTFSENSQLFYIGNNCFFFSGLENIIIPPCVTKIHQSTFMLSDELKKIEFSNKSKLRGIDEYAFISSSVQSITIPSSIVNFKDSWCNNVLNIVDIKVFPSDEINIIYHNNEFILGKSDPKSDTFDIIYFARRDIEKAVIPSFIKQISEFAFNGCQKLKTVEFQKDSQLQIIEKHAFSLTSIESIVIPSNVIQIDKNAFCQCLNLKTIEFSKNSKLKIIGTYAFQSSIIESIQIPSSIIKIEELCFSQCNNLKTIEFSKNSQLKTICKDAFLHSKLENLSIPSNIVDLRDGWCNLRYNLKKITIFPNKNEVNIIYFDNKFILGKSDSKSSEFDILYYARKDIEKVIIPPFIVKIASHAFANSKKLNKAEFVNNSKLKLIEKFSFSNTSIKSISFPPKVKIGNYAFSGCEKLQIIEFNDYREPILFNKLFFTKNIYIIILISHDKFY